MGRNSSGVKGINLIGDDEVVGMVVADPGAELLTVCAHGHGKRTPFGPNVQESVPEEGAAEEAGSDEELSSQRSYRTQRRGGKGLRDIKTTKRNGPVIGAVRVHEEDELLMITAHGKLQRVAAREISVVGRNTQGVRIMNLDDDDTLVAVKRVPHEEGSAETETLIDAEAPIDVDADVNESSDVADTASQNDNGEMLEGDTDTSPKSDNPAEE